MPPPINKKPKPASRRKLRRKRHSRPVLSEWFVVRTKTGRERHAAVSVRRKGHRAFAPFVADQVRGHHRESPLFPGFIFVHGQQWYYLKATEGVLAPVMMGLIPAYMPITEMMALIRAAGEDDLIDTIAREKLPINEQVRVRTGPWSGHWGKFVGMKSRDRVRLLMTVLGAQHELEFDRSEVTTKPTDAVNWRELVETPCPSNRSPK